MICRTLFGFSAQMLLWNVGWFICCWYYAHSKTLLTAKFSNQFWCERYFALNFTYHYRFCMCKCMCVCVLSIEHSNCTQAQVQEEKSWFKRRMKMAFIWCQVLIFNGFWFENHPINIYHLARENTKLNNIHWLHLSFLYAYSVHMHIYMHISLLTLSDTADLKK